MKYLLSTLILLCAAWPLRAEVVDVSAHGVVPGEDATLSLMRLIDDLRGKEDITLQFPKGDYTFFPENARETYRAVSNHDNGLKRSAFPLFGVVNWRIDGGGSEFLFHGRMIPFVVEGAHGVTLENFSIDWQRPFHTEMRVVAHGGEAGEVVVAIDKEEFPYTVKDGVLLFDHYDWQDPIGMNIVFDPATGGPIARTEDYYLPRSGPVLAEARDGDRVRLTAKMKQRPPIGSTLVSYGENPTSRLSPAIHVSNSRDVHVTNVNVYAAGGMGIVCERSGDIGLDGFNVTTRGDGKRLVSTRADATHFVGCQGELRIENCRFESMLDDSVNVHGVYVKVLSWLGTLDLLCEFSHPQQGGLRFAEPGDWIALISRETLLPFYETTVVNIDPLNERRFILTLNKMPDAVPVKEYSVENLTWYPNFTMRNNTVKKNRARSVLATTQGKVLIENNYFSSPMLGILIEGDNNVGYESGGVRNVVIRNNVFENIGFGGGPGYALYVAPKYTRAQGYGGIRYHQNIDFSDNEVRSFNKEFVFAESTSELRISNNTFTPSTDYQDTRGNAAIDLRYCRNVRIEGNKVGDFEGPLHLLLSEDSQGVDVSGQRGFTIRKGTQ